MAGGKVIAVGPTYTTVTTTPGGISVEHLIGAAAGPSGATATQDANANWVMQAVAFKQAGIVQDFGISVTPPDNRYGDCRQPGDLHHLGERNQ